MRNNNIPKVRFKQFEGLWNEDKIGNIVSISAGGDIDRSKLKNKGQYPVVANALTNKGIVGFYDDYKVKAPAVTVTGRGDVGYAVARHENFTPIVRLLTLQSENIDVDYLQNQINSMRILNESTGVPQLTAPQLGNYKVYYPEIEEQSAIGSLFCTIDDLLVSYKDNLANYRSLKATMLSKMFPKAGQTVPEIRLDGFEGEWEVVNLGTLIENYDEIISGASGFPIATSSRKGLYLQNDYFEGGRTGIDLTLDFHRVPMGYVTYRHMSDDSIFKFNKNNFETDVLVSKEYPVFISNDRSDIDFLLYHLNNSGLFLRFSTMQKLGGTRVRLYYKNLITYRLSVPKVKEQQAIGTYFSNLDNLIATHQEKISQLETLKKKLLQDMFI